MKTPDDEKVAAFRKAYLSLVEEHGMWFESCGCCGGLQLITADGYDSSDYSLDDDDPADPNNWKLKDGVPGPEKRLRAGKTQAIA